MAQATMVKPEWKFYESFLPALRQLDKKHGPLYLAVLAQFRATPADNWTLLVGSKKLAADRAAGIAVVADLLADKVPPESTNKVRVIDVVADYDPIFQLLSKVIRQPLGGPNEMLDCTISGIRFARLGILAVDPTVSNHTSSREPGRKADDTSRHRTNNSRRTSAAPRIATTK